MRNGRNMEDEILMLATLAFIVLMACSNPSHQKTTSAGVKEAPKSAGPRESNQPKIRDSPTSEPSPMASPSPELHSELAPAGWYEDWSSALTLAQKYRRWLIVVFSDKDCPVCRDLSEHVLSEPQLKTALEPNWIPVFIHLNRFPELVRQYAVLGGPTILLCSPDGTEEARAIGMTSPTTLATALLEIPARVARIAEIKTALKDQAKNPALWRSLGEVYTEELLQAPSFFPHADHALAAYRKAVSLDPSLASALSEVLEFYKLINGIEQTILDQVNLLELTSRLKAFESLHPKSRFLPKIRYYIIISNMVLQNPKSETKAMMEEGINRFPDTRYAADWRFWISIGIR